MISLALLPTNTAMASSGPGSTNTTGRGKTALLHVSMLLGVAWPAVGSGGGGMTRSRAQPDQESAALFQTTGYAHPSEPRSCECPQVKPPAAAVQAAPKQGRAPACDPTLRPPSLPPHSGHAIPYAPRARSPLSGMASPQTRSIGRATTGTEARLATGWTGRPQ